MPKKSSNQRVPVEKLRWRLDPATLPFGTTEDLKPLPSTVAKALPACTQTVLQWQQRMIGLLEPELLGSALNRRSK